MQNLSKENNEKNINYKNELKQYININPKNANSNNNNNNYEYQINNIKKELNYDYKIDNNIINNNDNLNGQEMNQNNINIHNLILNNLENDKCSEKEPNMDLYNELEEKLQNLYLIIRGNKEEPQSEIPQSIDDSHRYENPITYPNLKRYRQKSEPNIRRVDPNNLNLSSNMLRRKINENNNKNVQPQIFVKYPSDENDNKNLTKFKMLEENLKTENSTKRMIDNFLKQQNNPELKNILSELQMTIKKLPHSENTKENNSISTLPANYLFPFNMLKFQRIQNFKNNNNSNIKNNISEINQNKKIEKLKAKFKDFHEIINRKPKNKKYINAETNDKGITSLNNYNKQKVYSNLFPANNLENGLFVLEK